MAGVKRQEAQRAASARPVAALSVYAHLSGETASDGRAREHVNGQFADLIVCG